MEAINDASKLVAQVLEKIKPASPFDKDTLEIIETLEMVLEKLAKAI